MSYEVQNFQEDVIDASSRIPVLVDFWAAWCGPCRVLGPVLEKLAAEQAGEWKLAKVDTDAHPELSARYGIRGIPAVKLFIDGSVVDEFTGALPEHAVRKWLEEAIPSEVRTLLEEAEGLIADSDIEGARPILEGILTEHPDHPVAGGLLARLLAFEDTDRAIKLARNAASEPRFALLAESVERLATARASADLMARLDGESGLEHYMAASQALMDGNVDLALESLIEVLKVNRYLDDDGARKTGVALFSLLGDTHPLTRKHRRTFDMWLY